MLPPVTVKDTSRPPVRRAISDVQPLSTSMRALFEAVLPGAAFSTPSLKG
jgi:hypothetical protein